MSHNFKEIERNTYDEAINGRNVHDHLKNHTVPELFDENQKDRLPFDIMVMNLTGDLNIGTCIRTAILSGAEKVWIFGRKRYDRRGTVGSHNYIDIEFVEGFEHDSIDFDLEKFDKVVKENKLLPLMVEQGGWPLQDFPWDEVNWHCNNENKKLTIVMGNETNGIPQEFLKNRDVVSIPQRGVIRSFNVSTAMAMVTWDMRSKLNWI